MKTCYLLLACVLAASGCGKKQADEPPAAHAEKTAPAPANGVRIDAETQAKLGIKVAPLGKTSAPQTAEGFARVLDVGPLAAIESDVAAANAAAAASESEYKRLAALAAQDQAASVKSVEAAKAQAAADAAKAKLAARRIGLEWGQGLQKMSAAERARLLTDIASGSAALLRIDAGAAPASIRKASLKPEGDDVAIPVRILGTATQADPRLQTAGLLGLVQGPASANLPVGRLLRANLELGVTQDGLLAPGAALVRVDDTVWVYVKTGEETFERRDVGAGRAVGDGWFITSGVRDTDPVVTDGAASLLAAGHGPAEAD